MRNDFTLSVSKERYDDKNAIQWNKVKYSRIIDLSLENIAKLITEGYCYTSIYKKANFNVFAKTETNWVGTDFVIFDVDNIKNKITFVEYLRSLKYAPTIAYKTPNCNKQKPTDKRPYSRFRLLYAFDTTIIDKATYQGIYNAISKTFDKRLFDKSKKTDNCGHSPVQQFSGNATKNCKIIINDAIYHVSDFDIQEPTEKTIKTELFKGRIEDEFIQNLNSLKPTDFLSYYGDKYEVLYESELDFNDEGFAIIPNDYVRIQRNYILYKEDGKIKSKYKRLRDGQGRRHQLFCNAKIRCQIKPQITVEELIYNLVYDRTHFYDNSDGILTNQCLMRIALDAKKATYQMTMKKKPHFRVDDVFCKENHIKPNALKMIVRKRLNYEEIGGWYDISVSVGKNLQFAKDNGIKVSRATLYNFCNENRINPKGEGTKEETNNNITMKEEEPKNKAEISAQKSDIKQGGTTYQTEQESTIQRKITHVQYVQNDELTKFINETKNTMYFAAYPTTIINFKMAV